MRVFARSIALTLAVALIATAPALARKIRFPITNSATATIVDLRMAPAGSERWGDNLLEASIEPGALGAIVIAGGFEGCLQDFLITFADGASDLKRGIDLCDVHKYEVTTRQPE